MKFQLLPSSFEENGEASQRQHLACFVIDDCVTIDAGSLAMAASAKQRRQIRDIILTHSHLDHVAGLPLFIDDLYASLHRPVRVYATQEIIDTLERDIFNWSIYPRFSELENDNGKVMEYCPFQPGEKFSVKHLEIRSVAVNHRVPCFGMIVSDNQTKIAITSDTAQTENFWEILNREENLSAVFIECAFPNELEELANISFHLTPRLLKLELEKFKNPHCPIFVINLKPMYREGIVREIQEFALNNVRILEVGKKYQFGEFNR